MWSFSIGGTYRGLTIATCYVQVHAHYGFGPVTAVLSMNYLDRFLSANQLQVILSP